MKIKPKIESTFLEQKEYKVIAVNSQAIEFYLVQNDRNNFEWYESRFFDKTTVVDKEKLVKEELNEYRFYLVEKYLTKENRTFDENILWSLQDSAFYNQILFLKCMEVNGYELRKNDKQLTTNQQYQFSILKEQINSLSKTMTLLSDGYFPTILSIKILDSENEVNDETSMFERAFNKADINLEHYTEEIIDLYKTINEHFEWSYNWLKGFSICKKIFQDTYWDNQLLDMIQESVKNLYIYAKLNHLKCKSFYFKQGDGSEIKFVKMESSKTKTILKIQNIVH